MKFELLLVITFLIAIAIISLFISIWDVFIAKKRTTITFSATDFFYALIIGILAGTSANIYVMLLVLGVIAMWFIIIGIKTEKNLKEKEEKEYFYKNES